jgi:hypothetical protein
VIWTFLAGLLSRNPYVDYADYYWDALLPELDAKLDGGEPKIFVGEVSISSNDTRSNENASSIRVHPSSAVLSTMDH